MATSAASPRQAILYARVSTDEQAKRGYSLRDQEERLRRYCEREDIEVLDVYREDHSAKTFSERPVWRELMGEVKAAPETVGAVLFTKWSRFSRDATGALRVLRQLDGLGVEAQAVEQPIDRSIPEQLPMLGVYIMMPEADNQRRSINTVQGQRRAMREGRYVYIPPVGYEGVPGADGKQRLVLDDEQAPLVRRAFEQAASATWRSLKEIWREIKAEGLCKESSQFYRMLKNPVYCGQLQLKAWRDEPEEVVEGLHEGIISKELFREVQEARFSERNRGAARPGANLVQKLPLRGHLVCPECEKRLTGSRSKGRSKYYWYYHCNPCGTRYKAPRANDDFRAFLSQLEIAEGVANVFHAVADDVAGTANEERRRLARSAREKARRLEEKLEKADMMYFDGELEEDSYGRLKKRFRGALRKAKARLRRAEDAQEELSERLHYFVSLMRDLGRFYTEADMEAREAMIGSIFPGGLRYDEQTFRTVSDRPIISLLMPLGAEIGDAHTSRGASVREGTA